MRIYCLAGNGTRWVQIGQDIDGKAADDCLGRSVSLLADGSTIVIGAPGEVDNGDRLGQVTGYRIDNGGSSWEQLGQSIYGTIRIIISGCL